MHEKKQGDFGYLQTNPFAAKNPNDAMNQWHGQMGLMYNLQV